ncbi:DUF3883 domain-containing protein [Rhodovastum atsumiense]|nr:DUF3883 domain-containing protein [Rhodovastum atsumiense]
MQKAPTKTSRKTTTTLPKVIFFHIGWTREYRGAKDDPPLGKFGFIGEWHEALNFRPYRGRCYGYAPHSSVRVGELGAARGADYADGVLVIWTATDPAGGGRYIVGWYRNATVHRQLDDRRPSGAMTLAIADAAADDCYLVPVDERRFFVPSLQDGWPGQKSAFYANKHLSDSDLKKVIAYIDGQSSNGFFREEPAQADKKKRHGGGRSQDPETRARVERAAVDLVTTQYEHDDWDVESVESDNKGWDLEVTRAGMLLRVEVKGLSGEGAVELTPNEYEAMRSKDKRMSYRLAIVWNALSRAPTLTIFSYEPGTEAWRSDDGRKLHFKDLIGARVKF